MKSQRRQAWEYLIVEYERASRIAAVEARERQSAGNGERMREIARLRRIAYAAVLKARP